MTPAELKYHVEQTGSSFFDRKSMAFFGDTMKNYGTRQGFVICHDNSKLPVWILYRKRPVNNHNQGNAYFDLKTFKRVHPIKLWIAPPTEAEQVKQQGRF